MAGPRLEELDAQQALMPSGESLAFGPAEAAAATDLYRMVGGARGREIDVAIAAHGLVRDVPVWTLNVTDFADLPGARPPAFGRASTSSSIASVSRPVNVFCWLGW